jgi:hypothetical protein
MATGNEIVVSSPRRGHQESVIVSGTPKPGTVMERLATTALVGGKSTVRVYQPGTDGERRAMGVMLPRMDMAPTTAYTTGDEGIVYWPAPGELLNMLLADIAGTADDHTAGEMLIVDTGTGKLIASTGTPESEPFRLLETVTDPAADTLALCEYTGH